MSQIIHIIISQVFPTGTLIFFPVIFGTSAEVSPYGLKRFERIFDTVETFLAVSKYLAGDQLTLPDIFLWAILETASRIVPLKPERPKTIEWFKRMQEHPSYEFMKTGAELHVGYFNMCLEKNKKLLKNE